MARRRTSGFLRLILVVLAGLWFADKVQGVSQTRFRPASADEARIADIARRAGFPEATIPRAVAVARCESGFRAGALGDLGLVDLTWGPSIGPWQIRSRHTDFGTGRLRDPTRLTDPAFNARAAYVISNGGTDWSAWSCRGDRP
jgi:lysozyme-like protein